MRVIPADGASRAAALPLRARAGGGEPSLALVLHRAAPVPLSAVAQQLPAVVVAAGRGEDAREIASLRAMVPLPSETPLAPASIPGTMSLTRAGHDTCGQHVRLPSCRRAHCAQTSSTGSSGRLPFCCRDVGGSAATIVVLCGSGRRRRALLAGPRVGCNDPWRPEWVWRRRVHRRDGFVCGAHHSTVGCSSRLRQVWKQNGREEADVPAAVAGTKS